MSLKRLSANAVKRILDALHPRFLGRDQDHLVALADEAADDVFTQTQTYVQPLYDFRNDIESTIGASLVGVNDAGSYYIGGNVEAVLQELPSKFIGVGSTVPWTLVSGKPTTLGGYGITDAAPLSHVGSGGTAHADVVAGGASGFMTGTDKTKLDGIASGATANTGTVTSVAVANATGITWTGSPITTSGTLTPALSANLQAWSGLATSSKANLTANTFTAIQTVNDGTNGYLTIRPGSATTNPGFVEFFTSDAIRRGYIGFNNASRLQFKAENGWGINIDGNVDFTTGTVTGPTPTAGDNSTKVATTAFVNTPNVQAVASAATVTPAAGQDIVTITAQAAALTLANPTGSWLQGQGLVIRIKDNGTARAITYGTNYRAVGVTLPTTTVVNKTLYLGIIANTTDTKWDVVSVAQE